jgi:hypothetical protein
VRCAHIEVQRTPPFALAPSPFALRYRSAAHGTVESCFAEVIHDSVLGVGISPRQTTHLYLTRQIKVGQTKASPRRMRSGLRPDCSAVLRPCSSCRTRFVRFALCAQTTARSQLTMRAAHAAASPSAPRRLPRGPPATPDSARCALPLSSMRSELASLARRRGRRRGAQGLRAARVSAHRQLTSCSCLSAESAANAASSARALKTEHRRAVQRSWTSSVGSPSLAYVSWRRKKGRSAAGPRPGNVATQWRSYARARSKPWSRTSIRRRRTLS